MIETEWNRERFGDFQWQNIASYEFKKGAYGLLRARLLKQDIPDQAVAAVESSLKRNLLEVLKK